MTKMKQCIKCEKLKPQYEFHKDRTSKDGLQKWCKQCRCKYDREYYDQHKKTTRRNYRYEESHRTVSGVKQKRCSRCTKWKAESEFYKERSRKDGLQVRCKKCSNKANLNSRNKRQMIVRNQRQNDKSRSNQVNGANR
jgi:hypothetical protein